ncbi:MAG TPA: PA2169 family four-helix-bundle protein [Phycisphaerales bacterium]|nr:PA2169 family four-helix-bundle protein [Phycisphaerales bacterium]
MIDPTIPQNIPPAPYAPDETTRIAAKTDEPSPAALSGDQLDALHALIQYNVDSAETYRAAARATKDTERVRLLEGIAASRDEYAAHLKDVIRAYERDAPTRGTTSAAAHRWWQELVSTVSSDKESRMMTEAARSERMLLEKYESTIAQCPVCPVRSLLEEQRTGVAQSAEQLVENYG